MLEPYLSSEYGGEDQGHLQLLQAMENALNMGPRFAMIMERVEIRADDREARVLLTIRRIPQGLTGPEDGRTQRESISFLLRREGSRWRIFDGL